MALAVPAAAQQQGYDGENFVKAVREADNDKALQLLASRGASVINARDSSGDTALIAAIKRSDSSWTGYLLQQGADPNIAAQSNGDTPLIAAARIGLSDAVDWLIAEGARIDAGNRMGETALIALVQNTTLPMSRKLSMARLLLSRGADPDKTDSAAGYSARDYAKRDSRGGEMLRLIESTKPKPGAAPAKI